MCSAREPTSPPGLPLRNASLRGFCAWRILSRFAGGPQDQLRRKRRRVARPHDALPEDCPGQSRDGRGRATPPSRCFRCIRRLRSQEYSTEILRTMGIERQLLSIQPNANCPAGKAQGRKLIERKTEKYREAARINPKSKSAEQ